MTGIKLFTAVFIVKTIKTMASTTGKCRQNHQNHDFYCGKCHQNHQNHEFYRSKCHQNHQNHEFYYGKMSSKSSEPWLLLKNKMIDKTIINR